MSDAKFGVSIQARNAADAVLQIQQAEAAGIVAAWSTIGGAGVSGGQVSANGH